MNEKVQDLINKEIERLDALKKKERDEHLISLGLTDKKKSERKYYDYHFPDTEWDPEKKMFFILIDGAITVTDKEYSEICKYFPPTKKEVPSVPTVAEKTLNVIAIIIMIFGIIGSLTSLFTIGLDQYDDITFTGLIISLGILLTSLTTWSLLKVIIEIASNVRETKHKTEELVLEIPSV